MSKIRDDGIAPTLKMSALRRTGEGVLLWEATPKSKSDFALRKFLANDVLSKGSKKSPLIIPNACTTAKGHEEMKTRLG